MSNIATRSASRDDLAGIQQLLASSSLPYGDIDAALIPDYRIALRAGHIVGCVGLQIVGEVALLRSLAVAESQRGLGIAAGLVDAIEHHAAVRNVRRLVLLTTTAESYFARRGYTGMERDTVPAAILATAEFASICPASAVCMEKML